MHESDQSVSSEAWNLSYSEALKALASGKSIVFDAMMHTQKSRKGLFGQLDKAKVPYFAVYVDVKLETAIERNENRYLNGGRYVPDFVIAEKWRVQTLPSKEEKFKDVVIVSNDLEIKDWPNYQFRNKLLKDIVNDPRKTITELYDSGELKNIFPSLYECWDIDQENRHHTQLLHEHMIKAAELIEDRSPEAVISALLHDVGKSKTKEKFVKLNQDYENMPSGEKFVMLKEDKIGYTVRIESYKGGTSSEGKKFLPFYVVEKDPNAHFYNHEQVGAIMARRDLVSLGFDDKFIDEVYNNILYHMILPYRPVSDKEMLKLAKKVGSKRMSMLVAIRKADKGSSNTTPDLEETHNIMVAQVNKLLR